MDGQFLRTCLFIFAFYFHMKIYKLMKILWLKQNKVKYSKFLGFSLFIYNISAPKTSKYSKRYHEPVPNFRQFKSKDLGMYSEYANKHIAKPKFKSSLPRKKFLTKCLRIRYVYSEMNESNCYWG